MSNQTNKVRGEADFNSDEVLPWPFHTLKLFKFYKALSLQQIVRNIMQTSSHKSRRKQGVQLEPQHFEKSITERHLMNRDEKTSLWALRNEDRN